MREIFVKLFNDKKNKLIKYWWKWSKNGRKQNKKHKVQKQKRTVIDIWRIENFRHCDVFTRQVHGPPNSLKTLSLASLQPAILPDIKRKAENIRILFDNNSSESAHAFKCLVQNKTNNSRILTVCVYSK